MTTFHFNAVEQGIPNDGTEFPAEQLRDLLNMAAGSALGVGGAAVYFPSGRYSMGGTVRLMRDDFTFYRLRIYGDGANQSVFHQRDPGANHLEFLNTGGHYSAQLTIDGVGFFEGSSAVRADNLTYSEIRNCSFRKTANQAPTLDLRGNTAARLVDCHWYHCGDALLALNATVAMDRCTFGEDCGSVWVRGSLQANGCSWRSDTFDRGTPSHASPDGSPNGYRDMGRAAVTVEGGTRATFMGCSVGVMQGNAWLNVDQASAVTVTACDAFLQGGALVRTGRLYGAKPIAVTTSVVRANAPSALVETPPKHAANLTHSVVRDVSAFGDTVALPAAWVVNGNVIDNAIGIAIP